MAPEIWTSPKVENLLPLSPNDGHNMEQKMAKGTKRKISSNCVAPNTTQNLIPFLLSTSKTPRHREHHAQRGSDVLNNPISVGCSPFRACRNTFGIRSRFTGAMLTNAWRNLQPKMHREQLLADRVDANVRRLMRFAPHRILRGLINLFVA